MPRVLLVGCVDAAERRAGEQRRVLGFLLRRDRGRGSGRRDRRRGRSRGREHRLKSTFEIEWRGGAAEKHFRKLRPLPAELPWGTLDASKHAPADIERARIAWSSIAISEYRAAVAFGDLLSAMLAARAPLDVVGMAGDFVADELMHVELASRLAMELGGGAPLQVDFEAMPVRSSAPTAFQRANDLVLRVGCVAETLSGAIALETRAVAPHPLIHAILEQIARDEARHTRLGWIYLEWAAQDMDDTERARLAELARAEIERLSPLWNARRADASELGWLDRDTFHARARKTILEDVVDPLAKLGIPIERERVAHFFCLR